MVIDAMRDYYSEIEPNSNSSSKVPVARPGLFLSPFID